MFDEIGRVEAVHGDEKHTWPIDGQTARAHRKDEALRVVVYSHTRYGRVPRRYGCMHTKMHENKNAHSIQNAGLRAYFYVAEHVVVQRQFLELLESGYVPAAAHHLDAVGHELGRPAHSERKFWIERVVNSGAGWMQ